MSAARFAATFLGLMAAAAAAMAVGYGLWRHGGPGAGLFPFVAAVLLLATSIGAVISSVPAGAAEPIDAGRFVRYGTVIALFPLLIMIVGTMPATACVFLAILRGIEGRSWTVAAACSLAAAAGTFVLFSYLLDVPLPRSILE
jgi:putative tricarboxylic transport membrane protein